MLLDPFLGFSLDAVRDLRRRRWEKGDEEMREGEEEEGKDGVTSPCFSETWISAPSSWSC